MKCYFLDGNICKYNKEPCKPNSFRCRRKITQSGSCTFTPSTDSPKGKDPEKRIGRGSKEDWSTKKWGSNIGRENLGRMVSTPPQVHVFKGFLTISKDNLVDALMEVPDLSGRMQTLFVAYNPKTKTIYMPIEELDDFLKRDCQLMITIIKSNAGSKPFDSWDDLSEQSILALYGYKVGKNGLHVKQRERILSFLFDNNILKCNEIISHLQGCIKMREYRDDIDFSEAINDWKHDISFIKEYAKNSGKVNYIPNIDAFNNLPPLVDEEYEELPFG